MKRYKEASLVFEKAWRIKPKSSDIWFRQGMCLFNLKQPEAAAFCFDQCSSLGSKNSFIKKEIDKMKSEPIKNKISKIEKEKIDTFPLSFNKTIKLIDKKQEESINLLLNNNYRALGLSFYRDLKLRLEIRYDICWRFNKVRQLSEAYNVKKISNYYAKSLSGNAAINFELSIIYYKYFLKFVTQKMYLFVMSIAF